MGKYADIKGLYSDTLAQVAGLHNNAETNKTQRRATFIGAINNALTSAADVYQQKMLNDNAIEKQNLVNEAAINQINSQMDADIKIEDFKNKATGSTLDNIKKYVEIQTAAGKTIDPEALAAMMGAVGRDTNNKDIAKVWSVPTEDAPIPTTEAKVKTASTPSPTGEKKPVYATDSRGLIKQFEGYSPKPYSDSKGPAVGYGSTRNLDGSPIDPNKNYSKEELDAMFERDVSDVEKQIETLVKVPISPSQKAALASLAYNVGVPAFAKSTLLGKLNNGDSAGASAEFDKWINSNGQPNKGLISRRQREKELFQDSNGLVSQDLVLPQSTPEISGKFGMVPAAASVPGITSLQDQFVQKAQSEIAQKEAAAAKDNAEAAMYNGLMPGGGMGVPSSPEEAAAMAGWQPKVQFSAGGPPMSGVAAPQAAPIDLMQEKMPEGMPVIKGNGAPVLATSALDGRTKEPIFMPESAYRDQKQLAFNFAKGRGQKEYADEKEAGRYDDTKELITSSSQLIHKYADVFQTPQFKQQMAYMDRFMKDAPDKGIFGALSAVYINPAKRQQTIYKALAAIPNPDEREYVAKAINDMETKALGVFKAGQGGLGAVSLAELEMVRNNLMNMYLGKGAMREQMEHNILNINKRVADSSWRVGNFDTFEEAVNRYNEAAHQYGYDGYNYTTTKGFKKKGGGGRFL